VVARGLTVRLGPHPVLAGLDLTLAGGRWTCLLGASGSGKTTLLRSLAGLVRGEAGSLTCDDGLPLAGRVAWMAQQDLLLPWLSAVDNVLLGRRLRGTGGGHDRAMEMLERVGLGDRAGAYPSELSGGMRQRVALARTLLEDRPVVLMDEPFSALDAINRRKLQELAADVLAGRTVLLVTHDPLEALRLGHRVHVLGSGPAPIGAALEPPGEPPRAPGDAALAGLERELWQRLAA
jgi:putative hydroxymethylpyrimidine transport system ATP-binding protein